MVKRLFFARNDQGALLIPLLLLTMIVAVSGFGIWGLLRSTRKQTEIQLRLDECVGRKAQELKSLLKTLTASNTRMKWVRRSAVVALLAPDALEAIQAELEIELALQEGLRLKWQAQSLVAVAGKACPQVQALALRYPLLNWNRLPPDAIGPQAFEWEEPSPEFDFLFVASPHQSAATVKGALNEKDRWIAEWTGLR
jgi:hypothetical protein